MSEDTTDWTELREFNSVSLTESFVLSWAFEGDSLLVDLDLCLPPSHPLYEAPRPSEKICVRPATIEFPNCSGVSGDDRQDDPTGGESVIRQVAVGKIIGFRRTGECVYEMTGTFGTVKIRAERPILRITSPRV